MFPKIYSPCRTGVSPWMLPGSKQLHNPVFTSAARRPKGKTASPITVSPFAGYWLAWLLKSAAPARGQVQGWVVASGPWLLALRSEAQVCERVKATLSL